MYATVRANLHILFGVLSLFAILISPFPVDISSSIFITRDVTSMIHVAFFALGLYAIGLALDIIFIERSRFTVIASSIVIGMSAGFALMPSREFLIGSLVIVVTHLIFLFSHSLRGESIGQIYRFFGALVGVSGIALYYWDLVSEPVVVASIMFCHATLLRVQLENKLVTVSSSSTHNSQRLSPVYDASIYEDDQTQTAQNPTRVVNGLFQPYSVASHSLELRDGFHRDRSSKRTDQLDPNRKENPTAGDELGVVRLPVKPRNQRRSDQVQWNRPNIPDSLTREGVQDLMKGKYPLSLNPFNPHNE